ncbi:hypothetical protein BDZ97DRAFT_1924836 [Flammula alnicola]|nr:hypothetical protein BDZ97DRAFT_1924836 [Flammula alnicola]
MASTRWVAVDDTDSNIRYNGAWTLQNGQNWDGQGNFGATYLDSLHGLTAGQGSFSYTFDGSSGKIFGTTNIRNSSGVLDPTWTCQVDGTNIPLPTPFPYVENNWVLCEWSTISAGQHTVTVTAQSSGQAFLFDQFQYVPSPTAAISNSAIVVGFQDAALQYGSGWQNLGTVGEMAVNGGAVVTFPFYGTGISWYATTPTELPQGPSTAEYSIDGQSPTTFTVPGNPGTNTQYFRFVFQTGTLSLGHHTITVKSGGSTSLTPLVLFNLIIQDGATQEPSTTTANQPVNSGPSPSNSNSLSTASTSSGAQPSKTVSGSAVSGSATPNPSQSTSTSGSSPAPSSGGGNVDNSSSNVGSGTTSSNDNRGTAAVGGNSSGPPIGAIVGAVLGGIALIILIIAVVLFYRRRKKNKYIRELEQPQPFYRDISPNASSANINDIPSEASGSYSAPQMAQTGKARGFSSKHANTSSPTAGTSDPNTPSGSYSGPDSSHSTSGYGPYSGIATSRASEASGPSAAGSTAQLLQPNRGSAKHGEHIADSSQREHSGPRIVNHEDSGFRMPSTDQTPPPPTEFIEYPPEYTPA